MTAPAACAGVEAVMEVLFTTTTFEAALPPSETDAFAAKPVPVIVIDVPPAVDPEVGLTALTVGAGFVGPPLDFCKIVESFFRGPGAEPR